MRHGFRHGENSTHPRLKICLNAFHGGPSVDSVTVYPFFSLLMKIKAAAVTVAALCGGTSVWGAIVLSGPTSDWTALPYVTGPTVQSDFLEDTQASSPDFDLVGNGTQEAVYTQFDSVGMELGFRTRFGGDKNPPGFGGQLWIGADVNLDGALDIFIGANSTEITFNLPGTGANTSPSTTTIDNQTPLSSIAVSGSNYLWTPVTLGPTGNDPAGASADLDGDANPKNKSGTDYFLTFVVDFTAFATAVNNLPNMSGFDENSSIAYVVGTASQGQTLNADLNGVNSGTNDSTTWVDLGAMTPEISVDGTVVPEPGAAALLAGLGALGFIYRHRKMHKA